MVETEFDVIVIGGGAAGFFAAINAAEMNGGLRIAILERSNKLLAKVKISGGGRCNVAHAEYDPAEMIRNYPRGEKELRGPFHHFMTGDVISWFESHGVELKTESDGRMFPVTNNSQTIIDCFLLQADRLGIQVMKKKPVTDFQFENDVWKVETSAGTHTTRQLIVASGSSTSTWNILQRRGHTIVPPVPSLFTFNIRDDRISELPGIATDVRVRVLDKSNNSVLESSGPLLITHWGMSGPAVLRLSAWGARLLEKVSYQFLLEVNWVENHSMEEVMAYFASKKQSSGTKYVVKDVGYGLPKRLWYNLVRASEVSDRENWGDLSKAQILSLAGELTQSRFEVKGKSTFKEEFVTAGGVELSEINFKTFESKLLPRLYLVGEVLNIDAITGGFNFQNAWTGAYLAARAVVRE